MNKICFDRIKSHNTRAFYFFSFKNVCNWSPGCVIWLNYDVVGFQPWSVITTTLDSVAYCNVLFIRILCFSSRLPALGIRPPHSAPKLSPKFPLHGILVPPGRHQSLSQNLQPPHGFICPPRHRHLHPSISETLLVCPRCLPPARTLTPSPPPSFP